MNFDKYTVIKDNKEGNNMTDTDEVIWDGEWWNEYVDSNGNFHYGR